MFLITDLGLCADLSFPWAEGKEGWVRHMTLRAHGLPRTARLYREAPRAHIPSKTKLMNSYQPHSVLESETKTPRNDFVTQAVTVSSPPKLYQVNSK